MGVTAVANGEVVEARHALDDSAGQGAILFDAVRLRQADPAWFDPGRPDAVAVGGSGRGAAWFVSTPAGPAVLRHYRRGGLMARLSRDRYVFVGEAEVRSVHEFRLLARLRALGLPVPAPLAACYRRRGAFYTADLLVERVPEVRSLTDELRAGVDAPDWVGLGATLARFHLAGVFHADLNAHNILVDAQGVFWLIDFDRGRIRRPAKGWREDNLARLLRSLMKLRGGIPPAELEQRFERLRSAYQARYEQAT